MTDLRDRIAAAIDRGLADQLPSDLPDRYRKWIGYDSLADAVIEALGLKQQNRYGFHRCVSEWEPDETH